MSGFRLFVEAGLRVEPDPAGSLVAVRGAGVSLMVSLTCQSAGQHRDYDYCEIGLSDYPTPRPVNRDWLTRPQVADAVVRGATQLAAIQARAKRLAAKEMYLSVLIGRGLPGSGPDYHFTGNLLRAVAEKADTIVHALNPKVVRVNEVNRGVSITVEYRLPPDFSTDWRPDSTTPEDFYAR